VGALTVLISFIASPRSRHAKHVTVGCSPSIADTIRFVEVAAVAGLQAIVMPVAIKAAGRRRLW
jgi:hypothetical protein